MRHLTILLGAFVLAGCQDKAPPTWEGDGHLEATAEGTTLRLTWPAATDDALLEHVIFKDGDEVATVGADVREYLMEGLDDATTYEVTVEAVDEAGNRSEPLHATATTADETGPHWVAGAALRVSGEPPSDEAEGEPAPREPAVLEWDRAEDASAVAQYKVLRGDEELAVVNAQRHELGRPLEAGERETLAVVAVDTEGNESAPLRWRSDAGAVAAADSLELAEPSVPALANPTAAAPPQLPPSVQLNPAQASILDRVRRMGLKRPQLERGSLMLQQPAAQ